MWTAGLIGTVVGLGVLVAVRDKPQDCGFPPVDDGSAAKKKEEAPAAPTTSTATEAGATSAAATKEGTPAPTAAAAAPAQAEMGMMGALQSVLKLPGIWALAFTYFFIYMVRQGVTSWLVWYLIAEKGAANAGQAALAVSGLELGGLAGSTVAGFLSDMNIRKSKGGAGHVGKRIQVCMLYTVGIAACLLGLQAVPATASALQWITIAGLGFCIYGPQMLIGLSGAELVSPKAVGASQGILGWIAYLGAAFAGIPLAAVMDAKGYNGFFAALLGACAVALVLLTTQANAQSFLQRQDKATPGGSSGAAAPATA
jgi:sugar phosphate permease